MMSKAESEALINKLKEEAEYRQGHILDFFSVPVITMIDNGYVKDGKPSEHLFGMNVHDRLEVADNGKCLVYYNMQNGEGSSGDYRFKADIAGDMYSNPKIMLMTVSALLKRYGYKAVKIENDR